MREALFNALSAHRRLWIALVVGFVFAYHALLLGAMVVRFGHAPNFVHTYDIFESYRLMLSGTPSMRDAIAIAATQPWLDVGYISPQWRISEWSLMILPPQLGIVIMAGCLIATFAVVQRVARSAPCAARPAHTALAAALGAGLAGMANATLFWVVCCATPTWIVGLAMLGVSVSVAFMLEPLGPYLTSAGLALIAWAIYAQLSRLAAAPSAPRFFPIPAQRSA